jgi:hypothetical protein
MTRRDYAWHRMDTEQNLMVINSILLFEGAVDMERLVSTIAPPAQLPALHAEGGAAPWPPALGGRRRL